LIHRLTLSRYLSPGDSLSEILFGLIMTLTFTTGAGLLVHEGRDAVREMLIATIGCNVAWGIIDAAFYVSGNVFERARLSRVGERIRRAATDEAAAGLVGSELEELLGGGADPGDDAELYRRIARHVRASPRRSRAVTGDDLAGAFASFWLVFFSSIPAAVPFLLLDDAWLALRISNGILILLLFVTGFLWARHTTLHPWLTGSVFLVAGIALVAVAVSLGG
jgi:VIT1/CCC1 family predicted Fe2+/Mn2+ transporter